MAITMIKYQSPNRTQIPWLLCLIGEVRTPCMREGLPAGVPGLLIPVAPSCPMGASGRRHPRHGRRAGR